MLATMPTKAMIEKHRMSCTSVLIDKHGIFRYMQDTWEAKIYAPNCVARIWMYTGSTDLASVTIDGIRVPFRRLGEKEWRMPS